MRRLPRLALATPAIGLEPTAASLALLAGLTERGWRVQHFRSRARPFGTELIQQITGLPGRHLDAWLMPPEVCRNVFQRGCRQADLAVVEGTLESPGHRPDPFLYDHPGRLAPLIEALDLPTVAVVSCPRARGFHLPALPPQVDAILLDGLEDAADFESVRHLVRLTLRKPVLGAVEALPAAPAALREPAADRSLPEDLIARLARSFLRTADLEAIRALVESRPWRYPPRMPSLGVGRRFRVAYAMDEAFGAYFPDTLETLEALGAELLEFSPIRDEALPPAVDLVMIGCGFPDRFADALAANVSMVAALKHHVCRGHRIYTEGGGTAYLGRYMVLGDRCIPSVGILPIDAVLRPRPRGAVPVSRTLIRDSWLGPKGTPVRGYRSGRWSLRPAPDPGDCPARSGPLTQQRDLHFRHHAIGSLIHLHLAALPEVVRAFAGPHRPSLVLPGSRSNTPSGQIP